MSAFITLITLMLTAWSSAVPSSNILAAWRVATESELKAIIPARAPVEKERIETEFRTASGITDGNGRFIAGVVMITAGYAAEGKYSHFLLTHVPISIGDLLLPAGEYVFGYKRVEGDALEVKFYEAANGRMLGTVKARIESVRGPIHSLLIAPPANDTGKISIGRFVFEYKLST